MAVAAVAATIHGQYQPRPTVTATIHGQYQPRLCSGSNNTWSISTSTLQWQLQYMVNINLDFAVAATIHCQYQPRPTEAATIHGQYQPRPTVHYEPTSVHKTKNPISPKLPQMG